MLDEKDVVGQYFAFENWFGGIVYFEVLQSPTVQFVDGKVKLIASALDLDPKAKYLEELKSLID